MKDKIGEKEHIQSQLVFGILSLALNMNNELPK